jgi:hypothetical protein
MADFSVKRFNWLRSPSAWERAQTWRARQQEMRESFEAANSSANSSFFAATINQVSGLGAIAAQIASSRAQAQSLLSALNKLA